MRTLTVIVEPEVVFPDASKVCELAVLLPAAQVAALERKAGEEGQTVGQLIRRVIGDFLDGIPQSRFDEAAKQVHYAGTTPTDR
jgi:hypothetical protein